MDLFRWLPMYKYFSVISDFTSLGLSPVSPNSNVHKWDLLIVGSLSPTLGHLWL